MPAKTKTVHRCSECGCETPRWLGRCPECDAWGTLGEAAPVAAAGGDARVALDGPVPIGAVDARAAAPVPTGVGELDRVLQGGLVAGSVTIIGCDSEWSCFTLLKSIEIGLTSLPWTDAPLVLLDTDDIERSRRELIDAGASGLGEVAGGSLAVLGTAPVTNGDPATGIVDVPGARLAVVQLTDGTKLGLRQTLPARAV